MNDTTRWIMIILLLLLIAAAVFMLLRSPGKDKDTADRTDELAGGRDADRDGVPDRQEDRIEPAGATPARGVYDQEADARGGTLPAAERMDEYAHPDAVDDRRPEGTGGATRVEPTPGVVDETAEPYRPEAGAADDRPSERAPERSDDAMADAQPLTDADISDGGREEPLTRADQEEDGSEYPMGQESTTYRATEGRAVVVGDDRAVDGDGPAPADTGTGAPPTADDLVDGRAGSVGSDGAGSDGAGTGAAEATEDHHSYAPVFTEAAYGPGSAEPLEDGTGPAGWDIKANIGSMLFHTPESPSYDAVRAEVWFESEDAARAAGFAHWDRRRR